MYTLILFYAICKTEKNIATPAGVNRECLTLARRTCTTILFNSFFSTSSLLFSSLDVKNEAKTKRQIHKNNRKQL